MKCYNCDNEYNEKENRCWKCGAKTLTKAEVWFNELEYRLSRIFLAIYIIYIFSITRFRNLVPVTTRQFLLGYGIVMFIIFIFVIGFILAVHNHSNNFRKKEGLELIIFYSLVFVISFLLLVL